MEALVSKEEVSIRKSVLGVKELAEYPGSRTQTVYNQISLGIFPIRHKRLGGLLKWEAKDVDKFLDNLLKY